MRTVLGITVVAVAILVTEVSLWACPCGDGWTVESGLYELRHGGFISVSSECSNGESVYGRQTVAVVEDRFVGYPGCECSNEAIGEFTMLCGPILPGTGKRAVWENAHWAGSVYALKKHSHPESGSSCYSLFCNDSFSYTCGVPVIVICLV